MTDKERRRWMNDREQFQAFLWKISSQEMMQILVTAKKRHMKKATNKRSLKEENSESYSSKWPIECNVIKQKEKKKIATKSLDQTQRIAKSQKQMNQSGEVCGIFLWPSSISISSLSPRTQKWGNETQPNKEHKKKENSTIEQTTAKFHDALSIYLQFMAWVKNDLSAKWHSINGSRYANIHIDL